jgi:hypothetical protein
MKLDQIRVGHIVEFRHQNGVHTGTIKSVGRNGNDEYGSEVVVGDIYPHIYDKPTVTMHGGDLILQDGRGFAQVSNQPVLSPAQQKANTERARLDQTQRPYGAYTDDPALTPEQNRANRERYDVSGEVSNQPVMSAGQQRAADERARLDRTQRYVDDPSLTPEQNRLNRERFDGNLPSPNEERLERQNVL